MLRKTASAKMKLMHFALHYGSLTPTKVTTTPYPWIRRRSLMLEITGCDRSLHRSRFGVNSRGDNERSPWLWA